MSSKAGPRLKRSLSGACLRYPALTSVAVRRDTVALGMPVVSASSRLLTGAAAMPMTMRP